MTAETNPYIAGEDWYAQYNTNIEKLKKETQRVEIDKLVWHVFNTPDGKALLNHINETILTKSTPVAGNYEAMCIYYEGYREAFRFFGNHIKIFETRMKAEQKKVEEQKNGI